MSNVKERKKPYIDLLPSIFRKTDDDFFESFLRIFEKILNGIADGVKVDGGDIQGISETLDTVSTYFCPDASEEFLEWLSTWVGLVLKEDWPPERKREVIGQIMPIYRIRGTRRGLEEYLNIYIDGGATVREFTPFILGVNSKVGESTSIGFPYYFIIDTIFSDFDLKAMNRKIKNIKMIVEQEKPVHTDYYLNPVPKKILQVEVQSTVGKDTLLWSYE